MTDEVEEKEEEKDEVLPPPTALAEEEHDETPDPFLEGFADESLDPEEADALAMGYRVRGNGAAEEDEEEFFSADPEE